ncbi:arf-GAP with GTPase, ANK repeat and PH domain-containing protein 1-like isoform X3 [Ptychodera flava]|uniref:arf-GAP with GTPase, ANK repeat and PH domain-containing protein 1-like isoform X3 n=1 Tax=Ptychodera flava TaxID=63121 RepID=UPI003969FBAF
MSLRKRKKRLERMLKCLSQADAFVNSQEWTLSRTVPEIKLGIVGSISSGKSALVHRYLTGSYMQEESPEGGRFKKEIVVNGRSFLLLIRDEGGSPEHQFCSWVDAVILVFSVEDESSFNTLYNFYAKIAHYRNTADLPMILVGTQDGICESNPRVIDDSRARRLATDLKRCPYYETCATYGLNIERVFQDAALKVVEQRKLNPMPSLTPTNSLPSTPRSVHSNHFVIPAPVSTQMPATSATSSPSNSCNALPQTPVIQRHKDHKQKDDPSKEPPPPSPSSTPSIGRKARRRSNLFTPNKNKVNDVKNGDGLSLGSGRAIPIKQGYLYKRSSKSLNKEWKKKYVTLCDDGRLTYHPSLHDYMDDVHGKEIRLLNTTVKVPGKRPPVVKSTPTGAPPRGNVSTNGVANEFSAMTISTSASMGAIHSNLVADKNVNLVSYKDKQHEIHSKTCSLPRDDGNWDAVVISNSSITPVHHNSASLPYHLSQSCLSVYSASHSRSSPRRFIFSHARKGIMNGLESALATIGSTAGSIVSGGNTKLEPSSHSKKKHRRVRSSGVTKNMDASQADESDEYEFVIVSLDNRQWHFEAASSEDRDEWVQAVEQQILAAIQGIESSKSKNKTNSLGDKSTIQAIRSVMGNGFCADCESPNPDWASLNLGALICIECSGIHRNLGTHLSRVRSLDLDDWPSEITFVMTSIGNSLANSVWEVSTKGKVKPTPTTPREEKEKWIRAKYEQKEFVAPPSYTDIPLGEQLLDAVTREDLRQIVLLLAHGTPEDVNTSYGDGDGRTALHLSCALGNVVITQLLIWYNGNVNSVDADGRTALSYANAVGAEDCARVLQNNGCLGERIERTSKNAKNKAMFDKLPASVI